MSQAKAAALAAARNMEELITVLGETGMGPGWAKPEPSLWPLPRQNFVPAHWSYSLSKPALDAAGKYVSTELAERRNLILYNPIPGNNYATAPTLICAYQMVRGHETARSHRHSPNALRLVLEAQPKAYTVVEGKKIPMLPGDVLLTPNWAWHGHANESDADAYWIDFLDVPMVHLLGPMFMEFHKEWVEQTNEVDAESPFRFPWATTQAKLDAQATPGGHRSLLLGPKQMDTIALNVHRLDAGAAWSSPRSTVSNILAVMEGAGQSEIEGRSFSWKRGDVMVVPAWCTATHRASERSHLLAVSDEPLLRKLGWYREG
jgi:gentisate 1,2-dioxygenase